MNFTKEAGKLLPVSTDSFKATSGYFPQATWSEGSSRLSGTTTMPSGDGPEERCPILNLSSSPASALGQYSLNSS